MCKVQFGDLLQAARQKKGLTLRDLAERTGIHYSRLSRIEHGTRPAPGLAEIRLLADSLDVDMSELLVSSGTPREVMEHLVWSERIQAAGSMEAQASWLPEWSILFEKNTYRIQVTKRDGALCTVRLGNEELMLFDFGHATKLTIAIPPEAVLLFKSSPDVTSCALENELAVSIGKIRNLGQVSNLVLIGDGLELNALHTRMAVERLGLSVGDPAVALIAATAIRTSPTEEVG